MPAYYPVFLEIENRRCVVVGGGEVAERKVASLLGCGAAVVVVSPQLCPGLGELEKKGLISVVPRDYRQGDLDGAFMAIAATDDPAVNRRVVSEAREKGMLINVVDSPQESSFIVPSVVRRGDLVVAISTGGRSPALAKKVRQEVEQTLGPEYGALLILLSEVREELKKAGRSLSGETWQESITAEVLDLVRRGQRDKAKEVLLSLLGKEALVQDR